MQKEFSRLQEKLPGWVVHHTGGGIFVVHKDVETQNRGSVMVSVSDDLAQVIRRPSGGYVTTDEFFNNQDYYWEHYELSEEVLRIEDGLLYYEDAASLFDKETLTTIEEVMDIVAE